MATEHVPRSSSVFSLGRLDEGLKFLDRIVGICMQTGIRILHGATLLAPVRSPGRKLPSETAEVVRKKLSASLDELWGKDHGSRLPP